MTRPQAVIEGVRDPIGESGRLVGMHHHRRRPIKGQAALRRHHCASRTDEEEFCRACLQMRYGFVQDTLAEGAGKTLLGAKDDDDVSASAAIRRLHICGLGWERQRFADRRPDNRCVRTHAIEPAARFV